jgi:two-component system OmpR family sensor kinase
MKSWSITRQLLRRLLMLFGALWISGALVAIAVVTEETDEVFDNALEGTAKILAALLPRETSKIDQEAAQTLEQLALSGERADYISYQIRTSDGAVRKKSKNAPAEAYPVAVSAGFTNVGSTRYYTYPLKDGQSFVQVAEQPDERREAFYGLLLGFVLPLFGLLLVGAVIVWRSVSKVSEPLRALAAQIGSRDGQNLSPLDAQDAPVELRPIVGDTNRLLSRLKRALDAERAFATNWAHELRNPVAAAHAQAQLIANDLEGAANQQRANMVVGALQNLGLRIERLLQKSRAEAGPVIVSQPADLVSVAELVIDSYYYLPLEKQIDFDDGGYTALPVALDQDALAIVLQNLIDNAIAYSPAKSKIRITVASGPGIHVANDGAVVSADELVSIRSRFQRGSQSKSSGFGLGLSIVQQIVKDAGGTLDLRSPAAGRDTGFEAVVTLRAAPG